MLNWTVSPMTDLFYVLSVYNFNTKLHRPTVQWNVSWTLYLQKETEVGTYRLLSNEHNKAHYLAS